nr:hypothetical protein [Tanacetum cinerariifolium]
ARVKLLEDREGDGIAQSGEDAPIKGRSLDEGEVAVVERSTKRGSDDTEEMVTVLTSLDAASILTSGVSVSISPVNDVYVVEVPTGEGSCTPTEPHHTPTLEATPSPHHELSSSSLPPAIIKPTPTIIP